MTTCPENSLCNATRPAIAADALKRAADAGERLLLPPVDRQLWVEAV
jgi:hypothetical protein